MTNLTEHHHASEGSNSRTVELARSLLAVSPQPANVKFHGSSYHFVKRLADLTIAAVALLVLFPLFLVIAALIYLTDRGPVLYKQVRVGQDGAYFDFFKFRSMHLNADELRVHLLSQSDAKGHAFKMKKDPRITKVGRVLRKFSLDEMPQLLSVIKGDMSIVGPRPHLPSEVELYRPEQRIRLGVKPGLLCLREISGRSHLSFEEWVRSDVEYVQSRNLLMDLKIFLLAIPAVLSGKGAY